MKAKKIKDLLIGSNNPGKVREIKQLLPKNIKVSSIIDYKLKSPVENGKTFLADDSGLEIDILHKKPGIYSARWGGKKNNFNLAIEKVFKELGKVDKNWKNKKITARFICALSVYGLTTRKIHAVA